MVYVFITNILWPHYNDIKIKIKLVEKSIEGFFFFRMSLINSSNKYKSFNSFHEYL